MATKPPRRTRPAKFDTSLDKLDEQVNLQAVVSHNLSSEEKDDDTRQEVARKFVNFYFFLLLTIIIGVPAYNVMVYAVFGNSDLALSLKDTILTYSAVVGSTFGLVVAYYFKSSKKD
jgi:uncharacterized membrane protein